MNDYSSAVVLEKDSIKLWLSKADTERILKKYEDALESYRNALLIEPENFTIWSEYINTLIENKKLSRASALIDSLIFLNSNKAEMYYLKAKVYFLMKEVEKGIDMIYKGFELKPEDKFDFDFNKDWQKVIDFLIKY